MNENNLLEEAVQAVSTSEATQEVESVQTTEAELEVQPEVQQDPLKVELNKVQRTNKRSELEKAAFSLQKNAERLKELGGDPRAIIGTETSDDEDDVPVTVGMLKRLKQQEIGQTALQLAERIDNEAERELVKYHLQNTIKSTSDPESDLKIARAIVNDLKNKRIIEEVSRKPAPKSYPGSSGVPAKRETNATFSAEELQMMKAPFNMSKEEVLAAREGKKYDFRNFKN